MPTTAAGYGPEAPRDMPITSGKTTAPATPAHPVRPSPSHRFPHWSGSRRRTVLAVFVGLVTLGSGINNLYSVMGGPTHPKFFEDIFPLGFIHWSRTATILVGFALIVASLNLFKRKRRAWVAVVALSAFSTVFHLTKDLGYNEAAFSFALIILLILTRKTFTVKSGAPRLRSGLVRLAVAAAVAIGYGIAGFWFLDERHFGINFHIGDSIWTTLRLLLLAGDPRLVPHTHYAHWFLNSLYVITGVALLYSGFALFRPVIHEFSTLPRERRLAKQIVAQYGRTSLDYFKIWPDKSYFFSPSNRTFIAYGVAGNVALTLGDPVGAEEEIAPTIRAFLQMCWENEWAVGFHQTLPDFLNIYRDLRLKKLKIGDDAVVDVQNYSLEGKSKKEFRYKVRQLETLGVRTVEYAAPVPDEVLDRLKQVSDEWLRIPGRRERGFTLGLFDLAYVRTTPVIAAVDGNGEILAFVNLVSTPDHKEITGDLMRRRTDAPNGIMDYLFIKLFLYAKEQGYERFNLGMAPMAGFQEREEASAEERAIHSFFQQLNFLFSFRGLRHYKAKFATDWEPRYLVYRNILELPRLALALRRLSEIKEETPEPLAEQEVYGAV